MYVVEKFDGTNVVNTENPRIYIMSHTHRQTKTHTHTRASTHRLHILASKSVDLALATVDADVILHRSVSQQTTPC